MRHHDKLPHLIANQATTLATFPSKSATPSGKVRVRKTRQENAPDARFSSVSPTSANTHSSAHLAVDSLGYSLRLAARVLLLVRAGKSLNAALASISNEPAVARSAAQDIAYGVLRRFGEGDFFLAKLMSRPLLHEETYALLLAALFRLETRTDSAHMVVDQAVSAAGEMSGNVFKGLVNGVLRNYLRQRAVLQASFKSNEVARSLHPPWWLTRLRRAYPDQWRTIIAAANTFPPMSLRVNLRRISVADYLKKLENAAISVRSFTAQGLILEKPTNVELLPGFAEGEVSVQDFGAQRAASLLAPASGARVLDACAAPGGKTAHLLELADLDLVALDVDAKRAERITSGLARLGLTADVKAADCTDVNSWWDGKPFDAILADVPCSGSGVARRHPDIKSLRRESDIRAFGQTQATILDALWPLLKPGGKFLYATCSVFAEENAGQIDAFLVRHSDSERLIDEQWLPQEDNDGFYYALLRKKP